MATAPRDANREPSVLLDDDTLSIAEPQTGHNFSGAGVIAGHVAVVDGSGTQITTFGGSSSIISPIGQKVMASSVAVVIASDQSAVPVSGAFYQATQPVSGTVNLTTPTAIVAFVTTVTTAGTRIQLASNSISAGILEAPSTNTGKIYIGGSTVSSTVFGAELSPGQSTGISLNNTNLIYIDSSINGDKCSFLGS